MIKIAIDPDLTGAIVYGDIEITGIIDMPTILDPHRPKKTSKRKVLDEAAIESFLSALKNTYAKQKVYIERQQFFPGERGNSKKLQHYGFFRGLLVGMRIPFETVHPRTWQAALGLRRGQGTAKERSIDFAVTSFPDAELIPPRCRKVRQGRADAVCIWEYAQRQYA